MEKDFSVLLLWNPEAIVNTPGDSPNTPYAHMEVAIKSDIKKKEFKFSKFLDYNRGILNDTAFNLLQTHKVEFNLIDYHRTKKRKTSVTSAKYSKNRQVLWLSQLPHKIISPEISISADKVLVMDEDTVLESEFIHIVTRIVLVLPSTPLPVNDFKSTITIIGSKCSRIIFDRAINAVINSERLCVQFKKIRPDYGTVFPPADTEEFSQKCQNIRLESLLINHFWTEHASYNNRYLDLIVYWEPDFGKVYIDERWKIEKRNAIILGKFFINECMKTKSGIRKKFPSLKNFEYVTEYIEKCNIRNPPESLVQGLEKHVLSLPSIFEMLIYRYNEFGSISKDFRAIKKILLERYIKFLKKLREGEYDSIFDPEILLENVDSFLSNLGFHLYERNLEKKIYKFLKKTTITDSINFQKLVYPFFAPFLSLIKNRQSKHLLFENLLTGDISTYSEDLEVTSGGTLSKVAKSAVQYTLMQGTKIILKEATKVVAKEGAKQAAKTGFKEATKRVALNLMKGINIPLAIGMSVAEVAINVIALHINSGYFDVVLEF